MAEESLIYSYYNCYKLLCILLRLGLYLRVFRVSQSVELSVQLFQQFCIVKFSVSVNL